MRKDYYTIKEIVEITGRTKDTIWRWCREKSKLDSEKIAGSVFVIPKTSKNEEWIKTHTKK
jgi:predicted transcriptional regulator